MLPNPPLGRRAVIGEGIGALNVLRRWMPFLFIFAFVQQIDFPKYLIGIFDPKLCLTGVTAFNAVFTLRADPGRFEPCLHLHQCFGIWQSLADVIQRSARVWPAWDEGQDKRRLIDFEFRVVILLLRWFFVEEN